MRVFGLPGSWLGVADLGARLSGMSDEARRRLEVLEFWRRHGIRAAAEHAGVSERTLFRWQAAYRQRGWAGLEPGSRRPHRVHQRQWPPEVVGEIRRLRAEHPNLGKRKIHPLLLRFCAARRLRCPAVVTIGRLIADAGGLRTTPARLDRRGRVKRPRPRKPRKPKGHTPRRPGDLLAVDTMIAVRDGVRRYLFASLDVRSRFGLAVASPGLGSAWSRLFLDVTLEIFPEEVDRLLSDNGSEFEGHFRRRVEERGIGRYYTYPKSPKMNAHCERFNRTVQEEFLLHHEELLWSDDADLAEFNRRLGEWLLWYNTERPHEALGGRPPLAVLAEEAKPRADWFPLRLPPGPRPLPSTSFPAEGASGDEGGIRPDAGRAPPTRSTGPRPPPHRAPGVGVTLTDSGAGRPPPGTPDLMLQVPDCHIPWARTAT